VTGAGDDDRDDPGAPPEPADAAPADAAPADSAPANVPPAEPRPLIERIGLAAIALLLAVLFGGVSVASWVGGEVFLAVMAGVGCLMTVWVGAITLVRP
jgi:hypothetical protein